MFDFKLEGQEIIPLKDAISKLGVDFKKFATIVAKEEIYLIILPKNPVNIGIRNKNKFLNTFTNTRQNNPLNIAVEGIDGFVPHPKNNEKILNSLNWKACEPMLIAYTDGNNKFAVLNCPYKQASLNSIEQYRHEVKDDNIEDVLRLSLNLAKAYGEQVFYFKDRGNSYTEISIKEIYTTADDLKIIKSSLRNLYMPDFNDLGFYTENEWSNKLIKDINAAHNYLVKNGLTNSKDKAKTVALEARVRDWLEYRWRGRKNLRSELCLNYFTKAITEELNLSIDLNLLEADFYDVEKNPEKIDRNALKTPTDTIERNRSEATDLIILLDIVAEKHHKNIKGFQNKTQCESMLIFAGLNNNQQDLRSAIYSVIKESGKRKMKNKKI
ncbi:MAG: hypothetical protein U5L98_06645 [Halomonas sp.]|uniref:hypothetical protein n=1 Tax=Halomonas sp. TaxID=1486246 RepID=UPI002ACE11FC|nr:hypothetical protein [Halomonas sp.]MDZ7852321.1 hypothetical protein [Halomonas sp.]